MSLLTLLDSPKAPFPAQGDWGPKLTVPFTVGASAIVGQGQYPELWCLYSTSDASVSQPAWADATAKVRSFQTSRGRDSELADIDAGTAQVTVDNRDRNFDPANNAAIKPLNRWWLREQFSGETQDLFVGYAESYDQQWSATGVGEAVAVANLVDEFKVLALTKVPTTNPPRDSYGELVKYDNPTGYWSMDNPAGNQEPADIGEPLTIVAGASGSSFGTTIAEGVAGGRGQAYLVTNTNATLGNTLSTAALTTGQSGDAGGCSEFAIEILYQSSTATPSGGDNIVIGPAVSGGNQWTLIHNAAGDISLSARNSTPATTTVTGGAVVAGFMHHIVGTIESGSLRLYLDGTQVASSAWTGTLATMTGTPTVVLSDAIVAGDRTYDELSFYRAGLSAGRVTAHYQAARQRGFPRSQLPGARVGAVLDSVTSRAPRRLLAGTRGMLGSYMVGQPPLDELREARRAENADAMLYVGRDGAVVFLDAGHRSVSPWNTVQATFDDDGTDLPYEGLDMDYSESFLFNEWIANRAGPFYNSSNTGFNQTASDATSIGKYFKRSQSLSALPVENDTHAANIAAAMLAKYKDPLTRITSIELDTSIPAVTEAAFRRDLGDRIRIQRTPPGGGARIDQTSFIQKIEVSGANDGAPWRIRWAVSPL